jgi:hypothetical protein
MLEIITFALGFMWGMYTLTQIEKSISCNINRKNMIKNLDKMNKKKYD